MTAASGGSGRGASGRGAGQLVVVGVVVVAALLVAGALTVDSRTGDPNDPTSTSPNGTRGLVELAEHFGARVEVAETFPLDVDVALAFDDVPADHLVRVREWIRSGRTLVMADATSELTPPAGYVAGGAGSLIPRGTCDIAAFAGIDALDEGERPTPLRYLPVTGQPACFAGEEGSYAAVSAEGSGRIVALASASPLQNQNLDEAGNAALAVALLAPHPGTRVAVLTSRTIPGSGTDETLSMTASMGRILTPGLRLGLLQLGVALVVLVAARARRLGRPVAEPQPVQIAGSALVGAVGRLLQRRRDPAPAAARLRGDLRRALAERVGLPADAPPLVLAEAVAARTGLAVHDLEAVLRDGPVATDAQLLALADQIDDVREEVLHGRSP